MASNNFLLLPLLLLFVELDQFEPFDLHHQVFLFFLIFVFIPYEFLLFLLSISDGDSLGVRNHLVHLLDILELLFGEFECLFSDVLCLQLLLLLEFAEWGLPLPLLFEFEHFFLLRSSHLQLHLLLFLQHFLLMQLFFLGFYRCIILTQPLSYLHALDLGLWQHNQFGVIVVSSLDHRLDFVELLVSPNTLVGFDS